MLQSSSFRCMTTDIELLVDARDRALAADGLQAAESFFRQVEARFSRFRPDSELTALNVKQGQAVPVSADLAELVTLALAAARASGGVFDPTVIDALEAAGYDRSIELIRQDGPGAPRPVTPRPDGWKEVVVDEAGGTVRLPPGIRLDLGGIGKGWAADRAGDLLRPLGAGMVNAGGDLRAWGDQPGAEPGAGWLVALDDPQQPGRDLAWVRVREGALATSSITRRRWAGGHHLIDPRTARPADTDLVSVSALAPTAVQAEVAAKVALILGREAGLEWLRAQPQVEAVVVTDENELFGTGGIEEVLA
ncbi:MAG: FAD:protein FMN transferase [Anaerolineae bacterium]